MNEKKFDAIIIGSGIGGLAAGAILSKLKKKRVLVLEKHHEIGGLTHEFTRGKYIWDVGLHYLGSLQNNSLGRLLFGYLTDNRIKWNKMPYIFEKFVYPDLTVEVPEDRDAYRDKLIGIFPEEAAPIKKYFTDTEKAAGWFRINYFKAFVNPVMSFIINLISLPGKKLASMTTEEYLNKNFKDKKLKAVLSTRWGDYGIPPDQSAFMYHSVIECYYGGGGYYPEGGAGRLATCLEEVIESSGGMVLASREVKEILTEKGKAVGVKCANPDDPEMSIVFKSSCVISDAGVYSTFMNLIKDDRVSRIKKILSDYHKGSSSAILFAGLKSSPLDLGLNGENVWIFDSYEHNGSFDRHNGLLDGRIRSAFLSFPAIKSGGDRASTAQIITLVPYSEFNEWSDMKWKSKTKNYYNLKDKISLGLIDFVERRIPGFKDLVDYYELATPITLKHFIGQTYGNLYGLPVVPQRIKLDFLKVKTPIKGILLTGVDISLLGVSGGLMGGVATVSYMLRPFGFIKIVLGALNKKSRTLPSVKNDWAEPPKLSDKIICVLEDKKKLNDTVFELKYRMPYIKDANPGQHIKMKVSRDEWRSYSLVGKENDMITLIIDTKPGGTGSQYIKNINPGDKTLFRFPVQNAVYKDNKHHKVFIATGVGITPFLSVLEDLSNKKTVSPVHVIFGCRKEEDIFIREYMERFRQRLDIKYTVCVSSIKDNPKYCSGRITNVIMELDFDPGTFEFYVCGNPSMISDITKILRDRGAEHIYW